MNSHIDWLVPGFIGFAFAVLGVLKLIDLSRTVVGGPARAFVEKPVRLALPLLLLGLALVLQVWATWRLLVLMTGP